MKPILTINAGSSSFKCAVFEDDKMVHQYSTKTEDEFVEKLPNSNFKAIGHRVVHGGIFYTNSTIINEKVLDNLINLTELAPLHNAPAIKIIKTCLKRYTATQVAVFDTAFYTHMPEHSRYYAISKELADQYKIYRYGFHGISHAFLWQKYVQETNQPSAKIITLHLGSGCSATAISAGSPQDTSMGFTPNEGLVMATRSGDIDPEVVDYLSKKETKPSSDIINFLNTKSGLQGLSGLSQDMQVLLPLYDSSKGAKAAIDLFCYRIVKYIGAYIAALDGINAIIFSGGIGENAPEIRKFIIEKMHNLGLRLDTAANENALKLNPGTAKLISSSQSNIAIYVIATDENHQIARETIKTLA